MKTAFLDQENRGKLKKLATDPGPGTTGENRLLWRWNLKKNYARALKVREGIQLHSISVWDPSYTIHVMDSR